MMKDRQHDLLQVSLPSGIVCNQSLVRSEKHRLVSSKDEYDGRLVGVLPQPPVVFFLR